MVNRVNRLSAVMVLILPNDACIAGGGRGVGCVVVLLSGCVVVRLCGFEFVSL